jgi:hypothetical protein
MKILSDIKADLEFDIHSAPDTDKNIFDISNTGSDSDLSSIHLHNKKWKAGKRTNYELKFTLCHSRFFSKTVTPFNNVLVLNIPFCNNYGHCLHDVLPKIMYADNDPSYDIVLSSWTPLLDSLVNLYNIKFKRVKLVKDTMSIEFKKLTYENHPAYHLRRIETTRLVKQAIDQYILKNINDKPRNRLIYCTRNTSSDIAGLDTGEPRLMSNDNEEKILSILKQYCTENNLNFTLFNGQEDGVTMKHEKQLKLFNEAKIVVGPHGSAISNIIYLNPENDCKVCEFCSGTEVQVHGGIFNKNYNFLYGYLFDDFLDYYLIPFTKESTPSLTSIDINNLKQFLEEI